MSSLYYKNQKYTGPTLDLGSGSLTTDNKTIVGAINELDAGMQPKIKVKNVTIPDTLTIPQSGYVNISSYRPSDVINLLFVGIFNWGTITPKVGFSVTATGTYLFGEPNTVVTELVLRYCYY